MPRVHGCTCGAPNGRGIASQRALGTAGNRSAALRKGLDARSGRLEPAAPEQLLFARAHARELKGERGVLVQVLPDGRCGYAIDGSLIYVSEPAFFERSAGVMLVGNTQATRIVVGPTAVSAGIAPFINWAAVPQPRR